MNKLSLFTKFLNSKALFGFIIFIFVFKVLFFLTFINFSNSIFFANITKSTLVNMLNQSRHSVGVGMLSQNSLLDKAAEMKANDMIENKYFSHISPTGTTPWFWFLQAGYNYKYAGENLAIGFYDSKGVFQAWMDSSTHKENMLNSDYTEVGTAVLSGYGENNAIVVVQLFGSPNKNNIAVVNTQEVKEVKIEEKVVETEEVKSINSENSENLNTTKRVLSSSDFIEIDRKNAVNNFYYRFLNFAIYSYETLLQYVIYGLISIIVVLLTYILSFNFNKQINSGLVLRSLILILVLTSSLLINKDLIISFLPNQMII